MEKLVYFALGVLVAGACAILAGAYIAHTGINAANYWQAFAGIGLAGFGLFWFGTAAAALK